jgi:tetratricopeptide (TPR) repeat protein
VHQRLGEVFLQLHKLEDAIACFQTAIEINPDFSWAYNGLGECWSWKGNRENAIANYQKAVELNSDSETFRHKLEKVLAEQELVSEEEITDKVEDSLELEKTPIGQNTIEEAIASYRRAIELNPDDVESYRKLLEIQPENLEVWLQLGKTLVKQEQWEEATFAYGRALELNPHIVEAYKKMLEIHPNNAELYLQLGQFLAQQGDVEGAIAYWRQAVDLNPEFANKCFLDGLEGISYLRVNPESLVIISGELIQADSGKHLVSAKGNQGLVSYGPYIKVEDGLYRINIECEFFDVESSKPVQEEYVTIGLRFDVITHHAKDGILYEKNVYVNQAKAKFFIDLVDVEDLEIRFYATGISFAIHYIDMTCFLPRENKVADYYFDLGNSLERQGKLDRALAAYTKAVEFNSQVFLEKVIAGPFDDHQSAF